MLFIHYFNLTYFRNNTSNFRLLEYYLKAEFVFYIYDTLQFAFFLWVLFKAKQFHFNFTVLLALIYLIHIIDNIAIILMRVYMFMGLDDTTIRENIKFTVLMYISIFEIICALGILPCLIIERCFASYFVADYEKKQRKYVSFFLVIFLFIIASTSCFLVRRTSNTVYIVITLSIANVFALIVNGNLRIYNNSQYQKVQAIGAQSGAITEYSLTQRYQITENIKTLRMLNVIVFYMGFMNMALVISLMMSGIRGISPERQAVCSVVLDVCIFVYSNLLSHVIMLCCEKWRRQLSETWRKIGCKSSVVHVAPLCDTYGSAMNVNMTVDSYFDTLRNSWDVSTPVHHSK